MSWQITDLFPVWGDAGSRPDDNFQYDGEEQVNEKHFDYLWKSMNDLENDIRSALADIDNDKDGIVDQTDSITGGGKLLGDLTDSSATPITIWNDTNKEITDAALGTIDTSTLAADDGTGNIATTALQADGDNDGQINTGALEADSQPDGEIDADALGADGFGNLDQYDEALIKDGGSRELDAAQLAGGLGTANEILQTDGAAVTWADVGLSTDYSWTLAQSVTVSNNGGFGMGAFGTWDQILVAFDLSIDGGTSSDVYVARLNQDSGSNYDVLDRNGTRVTGESGFTFADAEHGATDIQGTIMITGRWNRDCTANVKVATSAGNQIQRGINTNILSPLSEIDIENIGTGSDMTGTVNVYGRDTP